MTKASGILSAALITLACTSQEPQGALNAKASSAIQAEPSAGGCSNAEKTRYVSVEGVWQAECLDKALPRETAHWASDGHWVTNIQPTHCTARNEPVHLYHLSSKDQLTQHETPLFNSQVGRGGALTPFGGNVVLSGGESCFRLQKMNTLYSLSIDDGTVVKELKIVQNLGVWPLLITRKNQLLRLFSNEMFLGELDLWTAPGFEYAPQDLCFIFGPKMSKDEIPHDKERKIPLLCGVEKTVLEIKPNYSKVAFYRGERDWSLNSAGKRVPSLDGSSLPPSGRELTYVYDPVKDRLISLGAIEPNIYMTSESDTEDLFWVLVNEAWVYPYKGAPKLLPAPPVVGDGVTLVWDTERQQARIVDPFGANHYVLSQDDSAWEAIPHTPLPIKFDDALSKGSLRFTQHDFPYFGYWDLDRKTTVIYPYAKPYSLCLPVLGHPEHTACPKTHP